MLKKPWVTLLQVIQIVSTAIACRFLLVNYSVHAVRCANAIIYGYALVCYRFSTCGKRSFENLDYPLSISGSLEGDSPQGFLST